MHERLCSPLDGFAQLPIAVELGELEAELGSPPVLTRALVLAPRIFASTEGEQRSAELIALGPPNLTVPVERSEAVARRPMGINERARVGDLASTALTRREQRLGEHVSTLRDVRGTLREHLAAVRKSLATLVTKLTDLVVLWRA
jgi:hypothetical protein